MLALEKPFWKDFQPCLHWLFWGLVAAACSSTLAFVWYQFELRRNAGHIYCACNHVVTRWIANPSGMNLRPEAFPEHPKVPLMSGFVWPHDLGKEMGDLYKNRKKLWLPRDLSLAAILLWTLAAALRIHAGFVH